MGFLLLRETCWLTPELQPIGLAAKAPPAGEPIPDRGSALSNSYTPAHKLKWGSSIQ